MSSPLSPRPRTIPLIAVVSFSAISRTSTLSANCSVKLSTRSATVPVATPASSSLAPARMMLLLSASLNSLTSTRTWPRPLRRLPAHVVQRRPLPRPRLLLLKLTPLPKLPQSNHSQNTELKQARSDAGLFLFSFRRLLLYGLVQCFFLTLRGDSSWFCAVLS